MKNLYLRLFCKFYGHVYEYEFEPEVQCILCNTCDKDFRG